MFCSTLRSTVATVLQTVRNRPREGPYGRAYGKFCRGGSIFGSGRLVVFVSRGQAWHFVTFRTCFVTCRKWFLCGQVQYFLRRFSEDVFAFFRGRRSTLERVPSSFFLAGRSTLGPCRVCVFFLSVALAGAASSGRQGAKFCGQAWHFCAMC